MNPATCQSVQEHLVEFLKLELPEIEEVAILRHLGHCPSCENDRKSLERTLRFLEPFGDVEPEEGGFDRLLERIHAEEGVRFARPDVHRARVLGALVLTASAAAVALIAAVLTWNARRPEEGPVVALGLEAVSGSVTVRTGERRDHVQAPGRLVVPFGGEVANDTGQVASIRLDGVGRIYLDAGTRIVLVGRRNFRLEEGEILLEATLADASRSPLLVDTPHAQAIVTGTTLDLVTDAAATALTVLEGSVRFVGRGGEEEVDAGKRSLATTDDPPTAPEEVEDLWRFHAWTTLAAHLSIDDEVIPLGNDTTLHFRLTNRSSAALSIAVHTINPPVFTLRAKHGDQVRPTWMRLPRFKDEVPRAIEEGALTLEPGESYRFSYRLGSRSGDSTGPEFTEPGLYEIEVVYNNGLEGTAARPRLWRGFLETRSAVWVTDASGMTWAHLGSVSDPARPEFAWRVRVTDLPVAEARALVERSRAERAWRDELAAALAAGDLEGSAEAASRVLSSLAGLTIPPGSVRLEPAPR